MALSRPAPEAGRALQARDRSLPSDRPRRQHRDRRWRAARRIVNDSGFESVIQVARESTICRLCLVMTRASRTAWADSAFARLVRGALSPVSTWPLETRVRFGGLTIAWAAAGFALS